MNPKQHLKWKLQLIFLYYTSYADRNNFKLLKQQNYRRFLIDSETIKTESSLPHFDIAFQKISHTAIIFKDFLRLVPEIAELVYRKCSRVEAFGRYMQSHMEPLYGEIITKSQFGQDAYTAINAELDPNIERKLLKIVVTEKSYHQYIASSMANKDLYHVFESFANFLKDFQVCPHVVSKSLVYVIFLHIMKQKNQNESFALQDFVKCIMIIGEVSSRKLSLVQLSNHGKMVKLLQRMEISAGFDKVSKKIMYQTAISPSFLKSFNQISRPQQDKQQKGAQRLMVSCKRHKYCQSFDLDHGSGQKQKKQQLKNANLKTVQNLILQQNNQNITKQFRQIKLAFEQLCQFGQVANSKTLKSYKIKKLFQRIGLTLIISQAWLDIQIVNLQRTSQTGKIQFPQFLQLICLVSKKIGSTFDQIVNLILNDKQISNKYNQQYSSIAARRRQYTKQQQTLLKQIIQSCEKQAQKIFHKYSVDSPLISFTQFTKMMYDFDIFPTIISKSKLYQIFATLNDVREEISPRAPKKEVENYLKDRKKIDFGGFLVGLIEVGQEICDESLEVGQKLIILLEKINQSEGYKKLFSASLVTNVRRKFSKLYVRNFQKQNDHVQDFDQLLQTYS